MLRRFIVHHVKDAATFTKEISQKDTLYVVDFFATWCPPCRAIAPVLEKMSNDLAKEKVKFLKVDVDELPEVAADCRITAMPTFQYYLGGKKVDELVGADPNKLKLKLETHLPK